MTLFVDDADFRLYVGDAREVLAELPDESVHCVVTSPPYWGLRMYLEEGHESKHHELGLEATPELFVAAMVEVFREVRRVLRRDGTCWVNLGDSYNSHGTQGATSERSLSENGQRFVNNGGAPGLKHKDLCGIPWRVAFALQADGWYLRSDIVWSKPNPMPESVTDRPTKAHEYVFLLTKSARYYYDSDAVREPHANASRYAKTETRETWAPRSEGAAKEWNPKTVYANPAGRNIRSVWPLATQPYSEAHFATFPEALPERCIKAGTSERGCCPECGAPWERETEGETFDRTGDRLYGGTLGHNPSGTVPGSNTRGMPDPQRRTVGWKPSCDHGQSESDFRREHWEELLVGRVTVARRPLDPVPCTVLDPFMGSGTTALVARKHGRRSIGIELNPEYAALCARRLQQLSLFGAPA